MPFIIFSSVAYPVTARVASVVVNTYLYAHVARDAWRLGNFASRKVNEWKAKRLNAKGPDKDLGTGADAQPC